MEFTNSNPTQVKHFDGAAVLKLHPNHFQPTLFSNDV
jgi:hypothetical protein